MKFLMNGCLLLATADGATVEIMEEVGVDNMVNVTERLDLHEKDFLLIVLLHVKWQFLF